MNQDSFLNRQAYLSSIRKYLSFKQEESSEKRNGICLKKNTFTNYFNRKRFCKIIGINPNHAVFFPKLLSKECIEGLPGIKSLKYSFLTNDIEHFGLCFIVGDLKTTPFVIALHGGGGTPEIVSGIEDSENYHRFVERLLRQGVNVFCPQLLLWDKEKIPPRDYDRREIDAELKKRGTSITALEMGLVTSVLNYFVKIEQVNPNTLGVIGMSYGGMYSLFLGAYDQRYKATFSSNFFNDREVYNWSDWIYPNARKILSDGEVATLIAPRHLLISISDHDCMFESKYALPYLQKVEEFYQKKKCDERFIYEIFNGDHEFNQDDTFLNRFVDILKI